ncbi:MAG: hypothetical protein HOP17_00745 [Acidobacteria bacterium]|nr:hypothetical protein [Acidobacteriota bacterium]
MNQKSLIRLRRGLNLTALPLAKRFPCISGGSGTELAFIKLKNLVNRLIVEAHQNADQP